MYKVRIFVTLKSSVLDPQGSAVKASLHALNYQEVSDVRIGKYLELELAAINEAAVEQRVKEMCDKVLANPVIEDYRFEIVEG